MLEFVELFGIQRKKKIFGYTDFLILKTSQQVASVEPGPLYKGSHEHTFQIMVVSCFISRGKSKHRQ